MQPSEADDLQLQSETIFRREALFHNQQHRLAGDILRISPRWIRRTYWLVLTVVVAATTYTWRATTLEYARGPAVVHRSRQGPVGVLAPRPGIVSGLPRQTDRLVRRGEPLVRLTWSRRCNDKNGRADAIAIEETVRAPMDGLLNALSVRIGERVEAGALLATVFGTETTNSVTVALPSRYLELVRPGASMSVQWEGIEPEHVAMVVDSINPEIIDAREAVAVLGAEPVAADTITGPMMLATAHQLERTFKRGGQGFALQDGMRGTAEVPVRAERLLVWMFPGLKTLFERRDG